MNHKITLEKVISVDCAGTEHEYLHEANVKFDGYSLELRPCKECYRASLLGWLSMYKDPEYWDGKRPCTPQELVAIEKFVERTINTFDCVGDPR